MRLGLAVISMVLCPATAVSDPLQESWCIDALEQVAALQETLSTMEMPNSRNPNDDIARQRKPVAEKCPRKREPGTAAGAYARGLPVLANALCLRDALRARC